MRENDYRLLDDYNGDLTLEDVAGASESRPMNDGRYAIGRSPNPDRVEQLHEAEQGRFTEDIDESRRVTDAANYDASEDAYAAYAMGKLKLGKWVFLLGARYVRLDLSYTGNEVIFDQDGNYVSTRSVDGGLGHGRLFPMGQLRYRLGDNTLLRLACTRSMSRPDYQNLVPYQLVDREDEELDRGNASLRPTTALNFDVLIEHYLPSVGLLSAGMYHKRLGDYIYEGTYKEAEGPYKGFEVTQPRNAATATLTGIELNWQQQLTSLPGPLNGLGVHANYTWARSSAKVVGRADGPPLPGQASHSGNVSASYEKHGFSGRVALNFHGRYIRTLGEDTEDDVYCDQQVQLDVSASQRLRTGLRVFVELVNLRDTPFRLYKASSERPIQQEHYSWLGHLGLKCDL